MKNDKIIQILIDKTKLIGLSDSGKVYEYINEEWELFTQSPSKDLAEVEISKEQKNDQIFK